MSQHRPVLITSLMCLRERLKANDLASSCVKEWLENVPVAWVWSCTNINYQQRRTAVRTRRASLRTALHKLSSFSGTFKASNDIDQTRASRYRFHPARNLNITSTSPQ
jgi:hypothetical protein